MYQPLFTSAIPYMPQSVTAVETTTPSNTDCVVLVKWDPPNNTAETLVKHYIIDSPSGSVNTSRTSAATALDHCGVDTYIRIRAVDQCDHEGHSTDDTLTDLLELTDSTSVPATESIATTETGDDLNTCTCTSELLYLYIQ